MKRKQDIVGFGIFGASCVVMLVAGVNEGLWTVFILGFVFANGLSVPGFSW